MNRSECDLVVLSPILEKERVRYRNTLREHGFQVVYEPDDEVVQKAFVNERVSERVSGKIIIRDRHAEIWSRKKKP